MAGKRARYQRRINNAHGAGFIFGGATRRESRTRAIMACGSVGVRALISIRGMAACGMRHHATRL
jgi:hypothetical protein